MRIPRWVWWAVGTGGLLYALAPPEFGIKTAAAPLSWSPTPDGGARTNTIKKGQYFLVLKKPNGVFEAQLVTDTDLLKIVGASYTLPLAKAQAEAAYLRGAVY